MQKVIFVVWYGGDWKDTDLFEVCRADGWKVSFFSQNFLIL